MQFDKLSKARKQELQIIKDNLTKYMLHAAMRSDEEKITIFHQAKDYFNRVMGGFAHNIELEQQGAKTGFIQIKRAPQWTLIDEIDFLQNQAKQVETLLPEHIVSREAMDGWYPALQGMFSAISENRISIPGIEDSAEVKNLMKTVLQANTPDDAILSAVAKVENKLSPYVDQIRHVANLLEDSPMVTFGNKKVQKFARTFLNVYYSELEMNVIKNIVSDVLALHRKPTEKEMMSVMFANSGPGLGKALQQWAKSPTMSAEMKGLLEVMESSGKPVPHHMVERLLQNDLGGYVFTFVDKKPLGTGTIAQVQSAQMVLDGNRIQVAVRFIKPGVEERTAGDVKAFEKLLEIMKADPDFNGKEGIDFSKMIESIHGFIKEDMDIAGTIERQHQAHEVYTRSMKVVVDGKEKILEVKIPKVYLPKEGKVSSLHVQELVMGGKKFVKLGDDEAKQAVAAGIFRMWFSEAMFETGFLHADLHQGNFKVFIYENGKFIRVVIFDFGLADTMSRNTRRAFCLVGAGAKFSDASLIARGFRILKPMDNKSYAALQKEIAIAAKAKKRKPAQWISWAIQRGYMDSDQIAVLARGGDLVSQLPNAAGDATIMKRELIALAKKHLRDAIQNPNTNFPLKLKDAVHIILAGIKYQFRVYHRKLRMFMMARKIGKNPPCSKLIKYFLFF